MFRSPKRTAIVTLVAAVIIVLVGFAGRRSQAQTAITYPPGWNLVSGPTGSHLRGAVGQLYTVLAGESTYETLPADAPLQAGLGYWAYFPSGGSIDFGPGTAFYSVRVFAPQWLLVGNPSDFGSATISGSVLDADTLRLAPGHATWVLTAGLVIVTADVAPVVSGSGVASATRASRPPGIPPDQATAQCQDGTVDTGVPDAQQTCAGHGGVLVWFHWPCGPATPYCQAAPRR